MRRAVVAAFAGMDKVIGILGHEPVEKFLQIFTGCWIGILHYDEAAAGVLDKNGNRTVMDIGLTDFLLNLSCHFVSALAVSADLETVMMYAHRKL